MGMLRFKLEGVDQAKLGAEHLQRTMIPHVEAAMDWFGRTVVAEAKADHPYQDQTGALTASIGYSLTKSVVGPVVTVFATVPYADAVEFGTATSRPFPFLFPKFFDLLPEALLRMHIAFNAAFEEAARIGN